MTSQSNLEFVPNTKFSRPRGCLYIFYEKQFIERSQPIYKIGYTIRNARDRLGAYEPGTKIVYEYYLNLSQPEIYEIESEIKRVFGTKFKPYLPSTERFEGDIKLIKNEFISIIDRMTKDKDTSYPDIFISPKITDFQSKKIANGLSKLTDFMNTLSQDELDSLESYMDKTKKDYQRYDDKLFK
jgi:hypothetical protein